MPPKKGLKFGCLFRYFSRLFRNFEYDFHVHNDNVDEGKFLIFRKGPPKKKKRKKKRARR